MPKFVYRSGTEAGTAIPVKSPKTVFGRADECDVVLADANVSRRHAQAIEQDGLVMLVDLSSSNGTFVNELPISQVFLMEGDLVRLGETVLEFSEESPAHDGLAAAQSGVPRAVPPAGPTLVFSSQLGESHALALKETYQKLKSLYWVFPEVAAAANLHDMFDAVGRTLTSSTGVERAIFFLNAEKAGDQWQRFQAHHRPGMEETIEDAALCDLLMRNVRDGQHLATALVDASGATRMSPDEPNVLALPLLRAGKLVALLYADNPASANPISKDDIDFISTLGLQLSIRLNQFEQVRQLQTENAHLRQRASDGFAVICQSEKMRQIMALTERVAATDASVLVSGESGTGKELVARSIHLLSSRSSKPLVAVNCAAMPDTLLESELFGHEKGAFTGAFERRIGKFELANGGTLFLDEIGDISAVAQAKLLRALQEGEIQRVGGNANIKVDVRLIAATNKNLAEAVRAGLFRQDLFFRIKVVDITVPPLRERPDDIDVLSEYFLKQFRQRLPTRVRNISPEALRALRSYSFPGNVRELKNLIERALVFANGDTILPEHFPVEIFDERWTAGLAESEPSTTAPDDAAQAPILSLGEVEKRHIASVLKALRGNKLKAASALGISRTSLYDKLRQYGDDAPATQTERGI